MERFQEAKSLRINELLMLKESFLDRSISSGKRINALVNVAAGYHFESESLHKDSSKPFAFVNVGDFTFVSMIIQSEAIPFIDRLLAILQK